MHKHFSECYDERQMMADIHDLHTSRNECHGDLPYCDPLLILCW